MQQSSRQAKRQAGRQSRPKRNLGLVGQKPAVPRLLATVSVNHVFRFVATGSAFGSSINRAMLLDLMSIATTTTNQFRVFNAIRIKRLRLWGTVPALGSAPNVVTLEWRGPYSTTALISDSSRGVEPGYIDERPPDSSSAHWWSTSGSNETDGMFSISGPVGTVIDLHAEIHFIDSQNADACNANGTAAASTIGTMYYHKLDSGGGASGLLASGGVTTLP